MERKTDVLTPDPPVLLHDLLLQTARRCPDRTALVCGASRESYAALADHAERLSRVLLGRGVRRGDRVMTFLPNGAEAVIAFWGCLMADAIVVPVNPLMKTEKLAELMEDCAPVALIADATLAQVFGPALRRYPIIRAVLLVGETEIPPDLPHVEGFQAALDADAGRVSLARRGLDIDLAALIYTSGSQGEPKGVMLSHRNMLSAAASVSHYLELRGDDVILCLLPLAFDYGLYQMIMSVRQGARLVLERGFTLPAEVMKRIEAERVTVLPGLPTMFAILAQLKDPSRWDCSSVRTLTSSGAPLPQKHIEHCRVLFPRAVLFSMYGLTECKRCTYLPPELLAKKPGSVGIAIPNTELWVVDEAGNRLGPNQVGELVIRGATVMQGYWHKPEATDRCLKPGPLPGERVLYTGDLCRLDEEGCVYFISRMDAVFKTRGEKVAPAEVESVLLAVPGVREVAVIGIPDPVLGFAVKAFVTPDDGATLNEVTLRQICQQHLESFKVPREIALVALLPRTESGKIRRTALA